MSQTLLCRCLLPAAALVVVACELRPLRESPPSGTTSSGTGGAHTSSTSTGTDTSANTGASGGGDVCDAGPPTEDWTFPSTCTNCHGAGESPGPPPDTDGHLDSSAPGVGAHAMVGAPASWHRRVHCSECHPVPRDVPDPCTPTHRSGQVDIVWGPVATGGIYDRESHACTLSYCHGAVLGPDAPGQTSMRTPTWTLTDGSQDACGASCHTLPPGGTHDPSNVCEDCHGAVIRQLDPQDPAASLWEDPSKHIDGRDDSTPPVDAGLGAG